MVCARKADKKRRVAMRKTVKPRSIYSKGKSICYFMLLVVP